MTVYTNITFALQHYQDVRILDLSNQGLLELDVQIILCDQLDTLILDQNPDLHRLPEELMYLPGLKHLSIRGGNAQILSTFTPLRHLESLDISGMDLAPRYQGDAKEVASLVSLGNLRQLRKLIINQARLAELPASFAALTQLEILHLDDNLLTNLPPWIGDLANLRELSLTNNELTYFPDELYALPLLRTVRIAGNRLHGEGGRLQAKMAAQPNFQVDTPLTQKAKPGKTLAAPVLQEIARLHPAKRKITAATPTSVTIDDMTFLFPEAIRTFLFGYDWSNLRLRREAESLHIDAAFEQESVMQAGMGYLGFARQGEYIVYLLNVADTQANPTVYYQDLEESTIHPFVSLQTFLQEVTHHVTQSK